LELDVAVLRVLVDDLTVGADDEDFGARALLAIVGEEEHRLALRQQFRGRLSFGLAEAAVSVAPEAYWERLAVRQRWTFVSAPCGTCTTWGSVSTATAPKLWMTRSFSSAVAPVSICVASTSAVVGTPIPPPTQTRSSATCRRHSCLSPRMPAVRS
jgi:hypothetical protein